MYFIRDIIKDLTLHLNQINENNLNPSKSKDPDDYSSRAPNIIDPIDSNGPVVPDKNAAALQMPKPTDYLINGVSSSEPRPGETNYTQTPDVNTQFK